MTDKFTIRELDDRDKGYALASWRESHKETPGADRVPWSFYKHEWGKKFAALINAPETRLLGAYAGDTLLGWIATTPGKRVDTLHWVSVKFALGRERLRRRGLMMALLEEAGLLARPRFVYTLRARRHRAPLADGTESRTLDEVLANMLARRGVVAAYVPLKEWLK